MKILLVEDDAALAESLKRVLQGNALTVEWLADGAQALAWITGAEHFDLVVLDLGLPGLDGMSLLRQLRAAAIDLPVLIITARDAVPDRVAGLNLGADDYLVKPFELDEFLARVRALHRRALGQAKNTIQLGCLQFDTLSRVLSNEQGPLPLTPRETSLLEVLLQNCGAVVSKLQIGERLFDIDSDAQLSAVEVYVHRLRKHLSAYGLVIRTVRGLGYMLEPPA